VAKPKAPAWDPQIPAALVHMKNTPSSALQCSQDLVPSLLLKSGHFTTVRFPVIALSFFPELEFKTLNVIFSFSLFSQLRFPCDYE
jgi:hypothetical protein